MLAWAPGTGAVGSGAHPYNVEVNGIDLMADPTAKVLMDGLTIEMAGPGTNGSMAFRVWDPDKHITINEWDEVRFIEHAATRSIHFGGFVQSVTMTAQGSPTGRWFDVVCQGYGCLLDRKIIDSASAWDVVIGPALQALVGTYGGRVTASGDSQPTADAPIVVDVSWRSRDEETGLDVALPTLTSTSLRSGLETWAGTGAELSIAPTAVNSIGYLLWVDAYARLNAFWDETIGRGNDRSYVGTATFGTADFEEFRYERDGSDYATTSYVVGGTALGTGFARRASHERAGDLEEILNEPLSTAADLLRGYGRSEVARRQQTPVRATATITSTTPLDYRPGMAAAVTETNTGVTTATFLRITGVNIRFISDTARVYSLTIGGHKSRPSAMRRIGRFTLR